MKVTTGNEVERRAITRADGNKKGLSETEQADNGKDGSKEASKMKTKSESEAANVQSDSLIRSARER